MLKQAFLFRAIAGALVVASLLWGGGQTRNVAAQKATQAKTAPTNAQAMGEIVVAIRYLLPTGVSHAHLFLYREDGKLLRQLTNDETGQDRRPVFAPDGETIVWTRETGSLDKPTRGFWQIRPRGVGLTKLQTAPGWYKPAPGWYKPAPGWYKPAQNPKPYDDLSPSFGLEASRTPAEGAAPSQFQTPDGKSEVVLREVKGDPDNEINGPGHGKHHLLRDVQTGRETEFGSLPGFVGVVNLLVDDTADKRQFLWERNLHVVFWSLHLNSTDGNTVFALDFDHPRFVELSPNWAVPIALPGQSAFLTLAAVRYVPIAGSTKTANSSYVERWDARLHKIRYAKPNAAALCYGASLYRPAQTPRVVTIGAFGE